MLDPIAANVRGASLAIAALAILATSLPAAAGTTSCKIPQPCAVYTNATGAGLEGVTTFSATSSSNGTFGLEGLDSSTNKNTYNAGVYGFSAYGLGVLGAATSGTGVVARSTSGTALNATTSSGTGIVGSSTTGNGMLGKTAATSTSTAHYGVSGTDLSTTATNNVGVLGTTKDGAYGVEGTSGDQAIAGVFGSASKGNGVYGNSSSGYGTYGYSSSKAGVFGFSTSGIGVSAASTSGNAFEATAYGGALGAYITSKGDGAFISGTYAAIRASGGSYPLILEDGGDNDVFYVDKSGNVFSTGTYGTFAAMRDGMTSTAYTARSTTPSVEDTGGARLVNGTATVAFDPAFGASIDAHASYHVFLTPNGDTRGLYVALKTSKGFVVRETQGGRATLDFDYRVVASAPGRAWDRMTLVARPFVGGPKASLVMPHALPAAAHRPDPTRASLGDATIGRR